MQARIGHGKESNARFNRSAPRGYIRPSWRNHVSCFASARTRAWAPRNFRQPRSPKNAWISNAQITHTVKKFGSRKETNATQRKTKEKQRKTIEKQRKLLNHTGNTIGKQRKSLKSKGKPLKNKGKPMKNNGKLMQRKGNWGKQKKNQWKTAIPARIRNQTLGDPKTIKKFWSQAEISRFLNILVGCNGNPLKINEHLSGFK